MATASSCTRSTSELGPVDVLAANAGLSRPAGYEEVDAAAFDETLAVNLRAAFLLARRVLGGMRWRGFAAFSSRHPSPGSAEASSAPTSRPRRQALHGLTHFLAARVAADGVTATRSRRR